MMKKNRPEATILHGLEEGPDVVLPSFFGFELILILGHLQVSLYVLGDRWRFAPQVSAAVAVTARAVPLR